MHLHIPKLKCTPKDQICDTFIQAENDGEIISYGFHIRKIYSRKVERGIFRHEKNEHHLT